MKAITRAPSIMLIAALLLILLSVAACNPFESKFTVECERALKSTLLAPSTYKRIEIKDSSRPISIDHYLASSDDSFDVKQLLRQQGIKPIRKAIVITYDASNAYNTPIRGVAECTYDTRDGDASSAWALTVKIDGKTMTDRLVDAAKDLAREEQRQKSR